MVLEKCGSVSQKLWKQVLIYNSKIYRFHQSHIEFEGIKLGASIFLMDTTILVPRTSGSER